MPWRGSGVWVPLCFLWPIPTPLSSSGVSHMQYHNHRHSCCWAGLAVPAGATAAPCPGRRLSLWQPLGWRQLRRNACGERGEVAGWVRRFAGSSAFPFPAGAGEGSCKCCSAGKCCLQRGPWIVWAVGRCGCAGPCILGFGAAALKCPGQV